MRCRRKTDLFYWTISGLLLAIGIVFFAVYLVYGLINDIRSMDIRFAADAYAQCPEMIPLSTEKTVNCYGILDPEVFQGPTEYTWICDDGFKAVLNFSVNICEYRNEPIIK